MVVVVVGRLAGSDAPGNSPTAITTTTTTTARTGPEPGGRCTDLPGRLGRRRDRRDRAAPPAARRVSWSPAPGRLAGAGAVSRRRRVLTATSPAVARSRRTRTRWPRSPTSGRAYRKTRDPRTAWGTAWHHQGRCRNDNGRDSGTRREHAVAGEHPRRRAVQQRSVSGGPAGIRAGGAGCPAAAHGAGGRNPSSASSVRAAATKSRAARTSSSACSLVKVKVLS